MKNDDWNEKTQAAAALTAGEVRLSGLNENDETSLDETSLEV
ncbi:MULTISPECIES: hypothetical protein [unclassified Schlesneria]